MTCPSAIQLTSESQHTEHIQTYRAGYPITLETSPNRTARMLIVFAPAGIEIMMEKMTADPDRYIEIGKQYGVEFLDEI